MTLRRSHLVIGGFVLRHCLAPFVFVLSRHSKRRERSRTARGHGERWFGLAHHYLEFIEGRWFGLAHHYPEFIEGRLEGVEP